MEGTHDHAGLEVLSRQECDHHLAATPIGRVAFVSGGEVEVFPVTYRWHEQTVLFRTSVGAKLSAATRRAPVTFEIDGWDPTEKAGWSVVVKGVAAEIDDPEEIAALDALELKPWASARERDRWIRIRPDEITGRKID